MKRKIIHIDESLCDGCGQCVTACHEGAIQLVDGKARLVSEVYCDGLGDCIGECPTGALTIEVREANAFDEKAVKKHLAQIEQAKKPVAPEVAACACPGSAIRVMNRENDEGAETLSATNMRSRLGHWPVQIMLIPPQAPFLKNADLLFCADCVPFALPGFHSRYLDGKAVLVGCPKLDDLDLYREKFKEILAVAQPEKITVLKMEVPCCNGFSFAVLEARDACCPDLPVEIQTIGIQGDILSREVIAGESAAI